MKKSKEIAVKVIVMFIFILWKENHTWKCSFALGVKNAVSLCEKRFRFMGLKYQCRDLRPHGRDYV